MKHMKIGIVCYPSVGGSGIVATNLGLELAKLGHKIHFISYEEPFLLQQHRNIVFHKVNVNPYSLFKYPDYTLPLAVKIAEIQKKFQLDIFHVHYAVPHATAALLARRIMRSNNTPLPKIITTLHGTDITLLGKDKNLMDVIKYSIERSHGVTVVSENLKQDTIKFLKPKKDIQVIYNFYSPQPITQTRHAIRKSLRINPKDMLAIHLSNLRPVKRIPDLLKITAKISNPKFKLLILSGGDFSIYEPLVKQLKLQKKLIIRHNIKDIGNYINASDVGIYTSETESFGMGILETMSYGKPILATQTGGIPEVVTNGQEGFLFRPGNIPGFVKQLKILQVDTALKDQMGQRAQISALHKFGSKTIVQQYLNFYFTTLLKKSN